MAGPRLGNAAFAEHVRKRCLPATHLIHSDDEVIKSNAKLWDDLEFEHVGEVVPCAPVRLPKVCGSPCATIGGCGEIASS